jgi:hypothetical protein
VWHKQAASLWHYNNSVKLSQKYHKCLHGPAAVPVLPD